ncbi:MAG TPA: hypothetical protein PKO09_16240 [Anaerolineae bacterium]|nr:hypothetical protein [Anaerolineae bacterium]
MCSLERIAFRLATDEDFRTDFANEPECVVAAVGLTLDEQSRTALKQSRSLLALSAEMLADRLLAEEPADPWWWWGQRSAPDCAAA